MKLIVCLALLAVSFKSSIASRAEYVVPNSVECISTGLNFVLSKDGKSSDLANETGLNVDLYTADQKKVEFDHDSGAVKLNYQQYGIIATSVYGSNQRPVMYNIDQPFYAVPKPGVGIGRNYSFTVGCLIPASYHIHIISNTTDDGHGDHGGGIVDPNKHIVSEVLGVRPDGTVSLGMALTYHLGLKDDMYAALVPVMCRYFDPANEQQEMNFVLNRCPVVFPDEEDGYLGTIVRKNAKEYEMHFKAFAFDSNPNSFLGINCDLQLCIEKEIERCYKPCWGPNAPTAAPETSAAPPSLNTTHSITTIAPAPAVVTTKKPAPISTTNKPAPPVVTTKQPTPETSEKPVTTKKPEPVVSTSEKPAPKVSTSKAPKITTSAKRPEENVRRKRAVGDGIDPVSTTISQRTLLKVNMPGTDTNCDAQPVCSDQQLLAALYAIIGALAVVTMVLVFTVVFLLCLSRKNKVVHEYPATIGGRAY